MGEAGSAQPGSGHLQREMAVPEPRALSEVALPPAPKDISFNWIQHEGSPAGLGLMEMSTTL